MNVLITGASGFFGGHIAEAFTRRGDKVVALVRPTSRTDFLKSLGVELRPTDDDLNGIDVVVHAAAKVDPYGPWREFEQATIESTRQILQAATDAGVRHFIHISSRGVYERPASEGIVYDESTPYGTPYKWSYYARAKIEAEKIARAASIPVTILRPTWLYGPRDTKIFPRLIDALRRRRLPWIGNGDNLLNLIYVTDAAQAVVLAAGQSPGQIYNLADDEHSVTQRQFITRICELLDLPLPPRSLTYRRAHRFGFVGEMLGWPVTRVGVLLLGGRRRFSNQKLRDELGWKPRVAFEEGIQNTVQFVILSEAKNLGGLQQDPSLRSG